MSEGGTSVEPPVTMSFTPANSGRSTQRTGRSSTKSKSITPDREMNNANDASDNEEGERAEPSDTEVLAKRRKTLRVNGRAAGGDGGSGTSRPGSRHSSRAGSKIASKYNTPNRSAREDDDHGSRTRKRSHSVMDMDVDSPPTRTPANRDKSGSHAGGSSSRHHGTDNDEQPNTEKKRSRRDRITRLAQGNPGTGRTSSSKKNASTDVAPKIKHLKKADGVPLWRKDIQYEFLYAIFTNEKKCFTNSYDGKSGQTFADVYIDAMARSSKTSKVLRDKLMTDRPSALNIAMVCLLVNIGRMNTTLNFFPEMRAQLRTYHPIPSLQTYADPNAYKQLQDAPRLKSILKGACEDRKEPAELETLIKIDILPRTNPINLTFLLASFAPRVTELHFAPPRDFFDLVMGERLSSLSRANAFLWLQWYYLESKFTAEEAENNPFGPGLAPEVASSLQAAPSTANNSRKNSTAGDEMDTDKKDGEDKKSKVKEDDKSGDDEKIKDEDNKDEEDDEDDDDKKTTKEKEAPPPAREPVDDALGRLLNGKNVIVPPFIELTEEEAEKENVDLQDEIDYGNHMQEDRKRNMEAQEAGITPARTTKKPRRRGAAQVGDDDSAAESPAPELIHGRRRRWDDDVMTDSDASRAMSPDGMKGRRMPQLKLRGPKEPEDRRGSKTGGGMKIILKTRPPEESRRILGPGEKRPRPPTQHQLAIQENRKERVNHEIGRLVRQGRAKARRKRHREGAFARCWRRIKDLDDVFAKSDDEVDGWDTDLSEVVSDSDHASRRKKLSSSDGKRKSISGKGGEKDKDVKEPNKKKKKQHKYNNGTNWPGPAGCIPLSDEEPDWGEETTAYADTLRRVYRRLGRWEDLAEMLGGAEKNRKNKKKNKKGKKRSDSASGSEDNDDDEDMRNGADKDDEEQDEDVDLVGSDVEKENGDVTRNGDDNDEEEEGDAEENGVEGDDGDVKQNGTKEKDGETDEEVDPDVTMNDD